MDGEVRYREICEGDYSQIKELHEALFPVKYSDHFYACIVKGEGLNHQPVITRLAIDISTSLVVGFIIAQYIPYEFCEDGGLLDREAEEVCYIMTLGTRPGHSRNGIGSTLLQYVINHAKQKKYCGAVYLHVIDYNLEAIQFYRKNDFVNMRKLINFYNIQSMQYDAYLYILFINGFRGPFFFRIFGDLRSLIESFASFANRCCSNIIPNINISIANSKPGLIIEKTEAETPLLPPHYFTKT